MSGENQLDELKSRSYWFFWRPRCSERRNDSGDVIVFTFLLETSDLWRITFKMKPNFPFISLRKMILIIFSQNSSFFDVVHEMIELIWKEFWAKLPMWRIHLWLGLGSRYSNSRQIIIKFHTYTSCSIGLMQQSSFQVHDFIMINYYAFGVMRVGLLLHDLGSLSDKYFLINKV